MSECIHELDPQWCSTCKHGPERKTPEAFAMRFVARYDGDCTSCDLPIYVGQRAGKTTRGRTIHEDCL